MLDRVLILSVFIVASCGLAYELIAGALASYLLGDTVLQFSSIIGCYLFAMGVGSHLSRYVKDEDALARFIDVELLVGIIGGLSATIGTWLSDLCVALAVALRSSAMMQNTSIGRAMFLSTCSPQSSKRPEAHSTGSCQLRARRRR